MIYTSFIRLVTLLVVSAPTLLATKPFNCITDAEARSIVADFAVIASEQPGYVNVAKKLLTSDFISISDSVNFADGIPVSTSPAQRKPSLTSYSSTQQ